jgi:hypothetical protein
MPKTFMTPDHFQKLLDLRNDFVSSGQRLAFPFVSVAQDSWGTVSNLPHVLFIGQAPGDCDLAELRTLDQTVERLAEDLTNLTPDPSGSAFWQYCRGLIERVAKRTASDVRTQFAWSNVFKLNYLFASGQPTPGPTGSLVDAQFELCVQVLRSELEIARPTHAIFAVGGVGTGSTPCDKAVEAMFGTAWSHNDELTKDVAMTTFGETSILWTDHPRVVKQSGLWQSQLDFVAERLDQIQQTS